MAINFNAQFIVNEKTATRVLRLTDTSTGFTLAKGNFSVTFPDGSQVLHTDFVSPDITAPGGYVDIALITDIDNTVLTGTYVINFVALNGSSTEYTLQRTLDFNWEKPIKAISNQSDVVLPDIRFVDSTPYETSGNFTGVLTRDFYTYTPAGSEVGALKKQSVGDVLTPSHSSKYYEGIYLVKSDISVAYTHSSYSWLTVTYTDLLQETYDIREAPTQNELVALMNEYKDQIEAYKTTNPDEYERRNEEYDLVVALYSHIIARFQTGTLDGCKPILDQLLGLLPPTNPYTYKATQMLPFSVNFTTSLSGSGTAGTITKFTGGTSIGDSIIKEDTGKIGIGKTPTTTLDVNGAIQGTSIIKSGGTPSQFLKADGSVDSNAYLTGVSWGGITGTLSSQTDLQNALNAKFDDPTGTTTQYIDGTGALQTFPIAGTSGTLIREVRNNTGATLTKGTIVYISGALGNKPVVSKAIATGDSTSAQTFGFCQADIPNNTTGYLVCSGDLIGLDTQAIAEGTQLYLSSTTAGAYTTTKQYAPAHLVYVGIVTRSHPTLGQIEVKIQNGYELDELHNVAAQTPSNNDALFYETSTSLWKNKTIAAVLGYTPVDASLTANYVPKATGATTLANSNIQDSGSLIILGSNTNISSGALGIGPYSTVGYGLRVSKDITGGVNAVSIGADGTIKSDVTTSAINYRSGLTTDAASFTLPTFYHFAANQGTIGAGSTVTTQIAFFANANLNGATNNYGFYGNLQLASNSYNLYMPGTADNYINGALGIGTSSLTGYNLRVSKNITGAIDSLSLLVDGTIQSDVTRSAFGIRYVGQTAAASFNLLDLVHISTTQGTIGVGSSITNQYGFYAYGTLTGATNNYGFFGNIASGTGRWNIYMQGTANNYLAGALGIGSTSLANTSLRIVRNATGGTSYLGVDTFFTFQSDVTATAVAYNTNLNTQAASFTLTDMFHFRSAQGTFGAGSTVTNQYGFFAQSNLIGATNNYGFYGQLAAATNRWNLYMAGTANNYLAGSLGIGTTSLAGTNLSLNKTITGGWLSTATYGVNMYSAGAVQSDVTTWAYYNVTRPSTAAAAFTMAGGIASYNASNVTIGSGSTVTSLIGYWVESTHIGGTNNFGFKSDLAANTNTWNFYGAGTANNYMAGSLGIGSTALTAYNLRISKTLTGATSAFGVSVDSTIQSDVTSVSRTFYSNISTAAATFTLSALNHFQAEQATIGAGSTLTTQSGFVASSTLTGATNNYGFDGRIAAGTGRWNLYMGGTADNYMFGNLGIGTNAITGYSLRINKNPTGATTAYGVSFEGTVQSDVTSGTYGFRTNIATFATAFTSSFIVHYAANQGTIGAGSSVTNQYGFFVGNNLTGATNNYAFFSDVASGTNRWNLYMQGTAANYLAGALSIGVTTANASALLQVDSTTKGFLPPRMTATQRAAISSPAEGLIVFQTDGTIGLYVYANATWRTLAMV